MNPINAMLDIILTKLQFTTLKFVVIFTFHPKVSNIKSIKLCRFE